MSEFSPPDSDSLLEWDSEASFIKIMARIREEDARAAAGEPVRTPEQEAELMAEAEAINEVAAQIPSDASLEEIIEILEKAFPLKPYPEDQPQDFSSLN